MSEVEIGGLKVKGGKGLAFLLALSSLIGALYGGFETYKDYMEMKQKLADLNPGAIQKQIDISMIKLNEAVDYAKDIKNDLRSDVIQVEKSLSEVEQRIRNTESENRRMVDEHQTWFITRQSDIEKNNRDARVFFDEKTSQVDQKLNDLEKRLNERLQRALDNPLVSEGK